MVKILELRSLLRTYYQKFQMVVDPLIKFVAAFVTFTMINKVIGNNLKLEKTVVVLLVSLLCAFTPSSILVFLAMAFVILHVAAVSPFSRIFHLEFPHRIYHDNNHRKYTGYYKDVLAVNQCLKHLCVEWKDIVECKTVTNNRMFLQNLEHIINNHSAR